MKPSNDQKLHALAGCLLWVSAVVILSAVSSAVGSPPPEGLATLTPDLHITLHKYGRVTAKLEVEADQDLERFLQPAIEKLRASGFSKVSGKALQQESGTLLRVRGEAEDVFPVLRLLDNSKPFTYRRGFYVEWDEDILKFGVYPRNNVKSEPTQAPESASGKIFIRTEGTILHSSLGRVGQDRKTVTIDVREAERPMKFEIGDLQ